MSHDELTELKWDKERFLPWINDGQIRYEHLHRYSFAQQFVGKKDVLELGCGEGYGTYSLSKSANSIIGIDIDEETIHHAQKKYINDNLEFQIGSVTELPEFNKKFDVIICFEVIEHIEEHTELLKSIKNLLNPSGILLISTPNTDVYSNNEPSKNPHHVKELSSDELNKLLKENFSFHKIISQKVFAGSFMSDNSKLSSKFQFLTKENDQDIISDDGDLSVEYFVGVCSDSQIGEFKINNLLDLDDQLLQYVYNEVRGPRFTTHIDKTSSYVLELQQKLQKETQLSEKYSDDIERLTKFIDEQKIAREKDREIDRKTDHDEIAKLYDFIDKQNKALEKYREEVDNLNKFIQKLSKLRKEDRQKFEDFDQKYHFDVNQCNLLINSLQESNRIQASSNNDLLSELDRIRNSKVMKLLRKIDSIKK